MPPSPTALQTLTLEGNSLLQQSRWAEAAEALRRALALDPAQPALLNNLGVALGKLHHHHDAIAAYTRALELDPSHTNAWFNLGKLSAQLHQPAVAIELLQKAISTNPRHPYAHHELGSVLEQQGHLAQAAAAYQTSATLDPTRSVRENLARVLALLGDPAGLDLQRQLVREDPSDPESHWNLGTSLLLHERFSEGWAEFEYRTEIPRFRPLHNRFPQPRWQGEPLAGRTILLFSEQGHGDTLQFLRYLPLVAALGGRIILEVPPLLHPLLQQLHLPGLAACIPHNAPRPPFDTHASLMSLPFLTRSSTIPPPLPLPVPRPSAAEPTTTLHIGLAWSGNPKNQRDHLRRIPLALLAPLASIPNLRFTSLQALPLTPEDAAAAPSFHFVQTCLDLDFAGLAQAIAPLDLVLSVDTAVAHLAGSLGKPLLLALPHTVDWRWGLRSSTTPWYPSARLFRQTEPHLWTDVIANLAQALQQATLPHTG